MYLRLLACIALIVPSAFGGWQRQIDGNGKGGFTDQPPPHPLSYYMIDPCLRPVSDRLVQAYECTWPGAPPPSSDERKRRVSTITELVEVGKIGAFVIYDLWYTSGMAGPYPPGGRDIRSVLIKTGPDQYREIDIHMRRGTVFPASEMVNLDGEPIVIAKSHDGGNHNRIDEARYMITPSGLETPDFTAVGDAVKKLKPANMSVRVWTFDYAVMTAVVETYRNDLNLPPVSVTERGRITVTFRFTEGRAVVASSRYEPHSVE